MNNIWFLLIFVLMPLNTIASDRSDLLTFKSKYSVTETQKRLIKLLNEKNFTIFKVVNHSEGARNANISLQETRVVIFGNPKIGSKLMQCNPTVAIDLPQKALIWQDKENKVWMSVNNPQYLKKRHSIQSCDPILKKISIALTTISNRVTN